MGLGKGVSKRISTNVPQSLAPINDVGKAKWRYDRLTWAEHCIDNNAEKTNLVKYYLGKTTPAKDITIETASYIMTELARDLFTANAIKFWGTDLNVNKHFKPDEIEIIIKEVKYKGYNKKLRSYIISLVAVDGGSVFKKIRVNGVENILMPSALLSLESHSQMGSIRRNNPHKIIYKLCNK